jgi:predicted TIM-barrel fold metal-dependent hydrolase
MEYVGVAGVRQMLDRGAGRELLGNAHWQSGLARLAERNLVFDLQITPDQAHAAATVIARAPDLTFALNHAGWPADRTAAGVEAWRNAVDRLASHDNVCVKLSGFGMFDHAWTCESLRPFVSFTVDRFGPDRCMFGSNFPVDRLYGSFNEVAAGLASALTDLAPDERDAIFFGTAARTYGLGSAGTSARRIDGDDGT